MKRSLFHIVTLCCLMCSCYHRNNESLEQQLNNMIAVIPGRVGVAFVSDSDTVIVNNDRRFPMMSVFKLHQSIAVVHCLDSLGCTVDTMLSISAAELERNTWSPMLAEYGERDFTISAGDLIRYALTVSDNNASNLLFTHMISPADTEVFIKTIAADTTFSIKYAESEMQCNHSLSYCNNTTPLSAALLIRQVFKTEILSCDGQDLIKEALVSVTTGQDRLGAILAENGEIFFAHKTGSGYRNEAGELMAHNDVGYFSFPDGRDYSLAVFISDFRGSEEEASAVIADISSCVFNYFAEQTF